MRARPFRAPHYSASVAALLGGGSDNIMPGEISLAHNGVLFIDEFCEAPKKVLEVLRGPMEDRKVTISRLRSKVEYPADFMLVAATNPCPCGYYGDGDRCTCTPCIADIGILVSTDPIAIDQACIDLVYACSDPGKPHLIERIESRNGVHTIEAAAALGYGSREYTLVEVK